MSANRRTFCFGKTGAGRRLALSWVAMIDISDRARAQERLQHVQSDFAHAARVSMLGELTASIAHEVNQPLAAIRTNGETALRWLDRPEPNVAKARASMRRILDDAGRAAEVVARIREMAAGRPAEQSPVALHEVIGQSLLFLRHELQSKGISISLDLAQPLSQVIGDHTQLQQVVVNLAINAVQALTKSEAIRRNISIRTHQDGPQWVCCIIEDSGPKYFQRIYRTCSIAFLRRRKAAWAWVSDRALDYRSPRGRIRADNHSALGGARFIFELPAARASAG